MRAIRLGLAGLVAAGAVLLLVQATALQQCHARGAFPTDPKSGADQLAQALYEAHAEIWQTHGITQSALAADIAVSPAPNSGTIYDLDSTRYVTVTMSLCGGLESATLVFVCGDPSLWTAFVNRCTPAVG